MSWTVFIESEGLISNSLMSTFCKYVICQFLIFEVHFMSFVEPPSLKVTRHCFFFK